MAFEIAKAGWVQRLSSVLRRWKRNWLVLYHDGSLKYFVSTDSHTAEEATRLPTRCRAIYEGMQVVGDPPANCSRTCMFSVGLADTTWTFCAESPDDMKAWSIALNEARNMQERAPHPGQVVTCPAEYYGLDPPDYVITPDGRTLVYNDGSYRRRRNCNDGLLGGMLLGGLMWGPILLW